MCMKTKKWVIIRWYGKDAMILKETLIEMNRLKSDCSAKSSIHALLMVHCHSLLLCNGHIIPYTG